MLNKLFDKILDALTGTGKVPNAIWNTAEKAERLTPIWNKIKIAIMILVFVFIIIALVQIVAN